jgi:hypothetical protein
MVILSTNIEQASKAATERWQPCSFTTEPPAKGAYRLETDEAMSMAVAIEKVGFDRSRKK